MSVTENGRPVMKPTKTGMPERPHWGKLTKAAWEASTMGGVQDYADALPGLSRAQTNTIVLFFKPDVDDVLVTEDPHAGSILGRLREIEFDISHLK